MEIIPTDNRQDKDSEDYYDNRNHRITDMLIGFFGGGLIFSILISLTLNFGSVFPAIPILVYFIALMLAFIKQRRYIGFGLLLLIAVPLLVMGSCLMLFGIGNI